MIASGFSESARVRKAQSLGAGRYIKKPYDIDTIGGRIMGRYWYNRVYGAEAR